MSIVSVHVRACVYVFECTCVRTHMRVCVLHHTRYCLVAGDSHYPRDFTHLYIGRTMM